MHNLSPCLRFDGQAEEAASQRALSAMLGTKKLDIAALQRAYDHV